MFINNQYGLLYYNIHQTLMLLWLLKWSLHLLKESQTMTDGLSACLAEFSIGQQSQHLASVNVPELESRRITLGWSDRLATVAHFALYFVKTQHKK